MARSPTSYQKLIFPAKFQRHCVLYGVNYLGVIMPWVLNVFV
jgi:hypothetical protein